MSRFELRTHSENQREIEYLIKPGEMGYVEDGDFEYLGIVIPKPKKPSTHPYNEKGEYVPRSQR